MNLLRHQFLGRLISRLHMGSLQLGNFQRGRRRPSGRGRHVLDVVVKSSRQEKMERVRRWKRGLQWGGLGALGVVLAVSSHEAMARYFWQNPDLRLASSADVRTTGVLSHEDILRQAGLAEHMHVYDVDLSRVRQKLEAMPNVRHATVERELPARLIIEVEERRPVFWLTCDDPPLSGFTANAEKGARLLDEEGHIFLCTELRTELLSLPVLHLRRLSHTQPGAQLTTTPVQTALTLLRRLRETFESNGLDVVEIQAPNEWSLAVQLSTGLAVTFGYEDLDGQFERLLRVVEYAATNERRLHTVNLLPKKNVPVTFLANEALPSPVRGAPSSDGRAQPVSGRPAASRPVAAPPPALSPEDAQLEDILGGGR